MHSHNFTCEKCSCTATNHDSLVNHVKAQHTTPIPSSTVNCNECDRGLETEEELTLHKTDKHGN